MARKTATSGSKCYASREQPCARHQSGGQGSPSRAIVMDRPVGPEGDYCSLVSSSLVVSRFSRCSATSASILERVASCSSWDCTGAVPRASCDGAFCGDPPSLSNFRMNSKQTTLSALRSDNAIEMYATLGLKTKACLGPLPLRGAMTAWPEGTFDGPAPAAQVRPRKEASHRTQEPPWR